MGETYAQEAKEIRTKTIREIAPRGLIFDRNGILLASNRPGLVVSVDPDIIEKTPQILRKLSIILEKDYYDLKQKISNEKGYIKGHVDIAIDIDKEIATYIMEHSDEFQGVLVKVVPFRYYPNKDIASHILGYIAQITLDELEQEKFKYGYQPGDLVGQSGVELYYENFISGKNGSKTVEIDPTGKIVRELGHINPIPGNNIYLTIDINLQRKAEEVLRKQIEKVRKIQDEDTKEYYKAPGGAIVILDAKTNQILAMASYPSYDPNIFIGGISEKDWEELNDPKNNFPLNNRALMSYPPGSIYKIVTAVAGLSENLVEPYGKNYKCLGVWEKLGDGYEKYCWKKWGHGNINFIEGIQESCNVVFFEIGLALHDNSKYSGDAFYHYSKILGLDEVTGVDLPFEYEYKGRIPNKKWKSEYFKDNPVLANWYPGDTVNMSIGQGDILISPIQIAQVYSVAANKGKLMTPYISLKIVSPQKELVENTVKKVNNRKTVDKEIFETIEKGFILVIKEGTAKTAFQDFPLDEIPVAGKTGTAEVKGKQDHSWFACYAPVGDPEYVIASMIEEAGSGGKSAAPIARELLEFIYDVKSNHESEG
jgi:penicillin-binding protein 2